MTCREFVDFLMRYLDGELSDAERSSFEAHMGDCPSCLTYLDTYRETVRLGKDLLCDTEELPEGVPEDLVRAILAAREEH